jgi:hypothetical protein
MKSTIKISLMILMVGFFLITGVQEVKAAYSPFEFAVPVETERYKYAIALIRQDNSMELIPVEGELTTAAMSPRGDKVVYVIRDKDKLTVYSCGTDGKNVREITDYRSDRRNIQDFIDVQFIKGGDMFVMAKLIKGEIGYIEHNFKKDRTRFISKSEWKGMPFTIHNVDPYNDGTLVFKLNSHQGGSVLQQIWIAEVYGEGMNLFLEIEAPPSIFDIIPDMRNKRVFVIGTQTRNPSVRNTSKSLMLIENMEDEPTVLADDTNFLSFAISYDGKFIIWRYSSVGGEIKFKRYNVDTGEITMIPAETEAEGEAAAKPVAPTGG